LFFIPLFSGCWSAVPLTLNEIQKYISVKEQSFTYSNYKLVGVSANSLKKMGFELEKILVFSEKGFINASWKGTHVSIELISNTPSLTTIKSKITTDQFGREHAIEEELFNNIRSTLDQGIYPNLRKQIIGMIKVYSAPKRDSIVIGYLRPGIVITAKSKQKEWTKLDLGESVYGYILSYNIKQSN